MIQSQKFLHGITVLSIAFLILSFSVWNEVRIFNNYYRGDVEYERLVRKNVDEGNDEEWIFAIRETWIENEMPEGLSGETLLGEGSPWTPGGERTVRIYEFWSSIPMVIVRIFLILLGSIMAVRSLQSIYQAVDSPLMKRRVWKGVLAIGGMLLILSFWQNTVSCAITITAIKKYILNIFSILNGVQKISSADL